MDTKKEIRFIDPHYNELFRIPDGGKIVITTPEGEKQERVCCYIDDYHVKVGYSVFHICEFAEIMKRNGNTYEPQTEKKEQTLKLESQFSGTVPVQLEINAYVNNGCIYIGLAEVSGEYPEPYGDLTVNLDGSVPNYCGYLDTSNMPELEKFVADNKLGTFTGFTKQSGFCMFPLYMFDADRLRDLCPDGMAMYEKSIGVERKQEKKEKTR